MVRAFTRQPSMQKTRSFDLRRMFDSIQGKYFQSATLDNGNEGSVKKGLDKVTSKSYDSGLCEQLLTSKRLERALTACHSEPVSCLDAEKKPDISPPAKTALTDMQLMKERFSKLLLGEDMSGSGKGVFSALALSNAITNLAASVFGEHRKLEPLPPETKTRWKKEIDWLLSVTDYIVEFAPSQQISQDGACMEIMVTRQRIDLLMNIPALRKLDTMLIDVLDSFADHREFWYASKHGGNDDDDEYNQHKNDKWWLPTVKVPQSGLSDNYRKWLESRKDAVNQVLKAAMAINAQVLLEMEIPESYIESLPKNGRESLGDMIYKSITVDYFDPQQFLASIDLTTEHKVIDLKNRIEASVVIWKRKMNIKDLKSPWGSSVSLERREIFEERAETVLVILKQRFPGISQSSLDISKIAYNRDVGQAVLESYSRILESLASQVLSRIEDVKRADSITRDPSLAKRNRRYSVDTLQLSEEVKSPKPEEETDETQASVASNPKTLSDIMGWYPSQNTYDLKNSAGDMESYFKEQNDKPMNKTIKKRESQEGILLEEA